MSNPPASPQGQRVLAAADEAARAATEWWRSADLARRARGLPDASTQQVETLLDRLVARAVDDPLDVHSVDDARARLEEAPRGAGGTATWVAALAGRTKRTISFRGRAIPLTMAAKLGSEVVASFRLGAYELEVLASLLVHRLRDAGRTVDPRTVQRLTVNAYVWPRRGADVARRRQVAPASLGGLWLGRMLAVEPAVGRVTKAAETLLGLDLGEVERLARPG
jgi:hypothetical protein